jgi:FtsZ-binding cell division protein ZapB
MHAYRLCDTGPHCLPRLLLHTDMAQLLQVLSEVGVRNAAAQEENSTLKARIAALEKEMAALKALQHKWQYLEGALWRDYPDAASRTLEMNVGRVSTVQVSTGKHTYAVDLTTLKQRNVVFNTVRDIRRVPKH